MTDVQPTGAGPAPNLTMPKLDVGATASAAWRVFRRQPWRYVWLLVIPVLVTLPLSFLQAFLGRSEGKGNGAVIVVGLMAALVQYCTQFACQMGALRGAALNMDGGSFRTGEVIGVGLRRLLPYIGVLLLSLVIVLVGLLLLVIPAFIAIIYLATASAACVIERCGPVGSVRRSIGLVRGNWWRTLAVLLLTVLAPLIGFIIVGGVLVLIFNATGIKALSFILILPAIPILLSIGAVGTILPAVLFVELRALKEGRAPGGVAGVF